MKIFAENQPKELIELLKKVYVGYQNDTIETLTMFGRQHALALYYEHSRKLDKALDIWCRLVIGLKFRLLLWRGFNQHAACFLDLNSRLLKGELDDDTFNESGLPYVANILSESDDSSLILTYAPAVLNRDATLGAQVNIERRILFSLLYILLA